MAKQWWTRSHDWHVQESYKICIDTICYKHSLDWRCSVHHRAEFCAVQRTEIILIVTATGGLSSSARYIFYNRFNVYYRVRAILYEYAEKRSCPLVQRSPCQHINFQNAEQESVNHLNLFILGRYCSLKQLFMHSMKYESLGDIQNIKTSRILYFI